MKRHDWRGAIELQFCGNVGCQWRRKGKAKNGRRVGTWRYFAPGPKEWSLPSAPPCGPTEESL